MLTKDVKLRILNLFVPLCDESRQFEQDISNKGIRLFYFIQKFEQNFCSSGDNHYKYMQELGKETIGSYDGSIVSYGGGGGYSSPYLSKLIKDRDEFNGMDFDSFQLTGPPLWELELDSCQKKKSRMQTLDYSGFEVLKSTFDICFKRNRNKEADRVVDSSYDLKYYNPVEKRLIAEELMGKYLFELGFVKDKGKSSKSYPVFCRYFSDELELCCGIRNSDDISLLAIGGSIDLVFHFRMKGFKRSKVEVSPFVVMKGSDKFLIINISSVIPYFSDAYRSFYSVKELELNIYAQTLLFGLVLDRVSHEVSLEEQVLKILQKTRAG